jgi:F0F1-type ATP synthase delta subunit
MIKSRKDLAEYIGQKTLDINDRDKLVNEIAAYLLEEKLTTDLDSLMRDVMLYRLENGIVEVIVKSAYELSGDDIDDIYKLLKIEYPNANSYTVDQVIDSSVIGGVKIEFPGAQLDLSIFNRLNLFKRQVEAGKI